VTSPSREAPPGGRPLIWLATQLLRLLGLSWRVRFEGDNPLDAPGGPPVVGALWHRNLFLASVLFRGSGTAVPVSRSQDGELVAGVLWQLGFARPLRGSSSRGGAAVLRQAVLEIRAGVSVAILTDGPKGPARRSKLGAVALARLTGAPIAPASFSASPCVRIRSWDGTLVPLPFARVVCRIGDLIEVSKDTPIEDEEALCAHLDQTLNRDTDALDDALGLHDSNRGGSSSA